MEVKQRCLSMLEEAHDQVKKRLPEARNLFKDLINYSPAIILNQVSRPIFSKLAFLHLAGEYQTIIEEQYQKLPFIDYNLKKIGYPKTQSSFGRESPAVTLFKMPSRKFVKKEKESWAERLECIVLACRSDEHIKNLFARDAVKVCEVHFERSDIVLKGSHKELREGAVPTLSLPKLTLAQVHSRNPPKKGIFETKVHFKSVASLKSARLPEGWQRSFENMMAVINLNTRLEYCMTCHQGYAIMAGKHLAQVVFTP
ncbi:unnamed protein product [Clavelina lepadiformis]|uniref:THAP-type domain-containing protein n=1 Tax=Clavelina lepadiformis TaxID=159417 RepID=A0ABP0G092_CLALP